MTNDKLGLEGPFRQNEWENHHSGLGLELPKLGVVRRMLGHPLGSLSKMLLSLFMLAQLRQGHSAMARVSAILYSLRKFEVPTG